MISQPGVSSAVGLYSCTVRRCHTPRALCGKPHSTLALTQLDVKDAEERVEHGAWSHAAHVDPHCGLALARGMGVRAGCREERWRGELDGTGVGCPMSDVRREWTRTRRGQLNAGGVQLVASAQLTAKARTASAPTLNGHWSRARAARTWPRAGTRRASYGAAQRGHVVKPWGQCRAG